ncbi:hypothetical protein Acr_00g0074820 [Actinidia rufa]|uniref:Uncharacterized protein n=1 Tax=Actinidia rufa TaxID=165716 RepID=A0A7J0DTT1_9ERIC|nr:hypothetical protein Acr_00g0074820 [Actinidia rufa]
MTQGDLDRLRQTCSFPMKVQTRILGKGETDLSASFGRDDWEFHPTIPREERAVRVLRSWGVLGKQCNKVPILSPTEEERFHQVFEKIGEGHFKIPVILKSRTFFKYFAPAESRLGCVGTIREEMRRISLHASNLDLLRRSGERDRDHFLGLTPSSLSSSSGSRLRRIKLSELAKVTTQKAIAPSSKGVVISEGSEVASKKRASDDRSKGKQVAPLLEAKKIKTGNGPLGENDTGLSVYYYFATRTLAAMDAFLKPRPWATDGLLKPHQRLLLLSLPYLWAAAEHSIAEPWAASYSALQWL